MRRRGIEGVAERSCQKELQAALRTTALSRHIGRQFCRAAAPTRRGGASQKKSLGPRAEFLFVLPERS